MVEELAVNAVEKKLDMQASILVGNYEYYYACGKLKGLMDLAVDRKIVVKQEKEQERVYSASSYYIEMSTAWMKP